MGDEPWVFTCPDMGDRYVVFPMYDLWMSVIFSGGGRTRGGASKTFLLTGPGWSGAVPDGMIRMKMPTRYRLILGRTYAEGTEAAYAAVNALQAKYDIRPLSEMGDAQYEAPIPPAVDPGFSMTDKPQKVILDMGVEGYFDRLAKLMCDVAPPDAADRPILAEMARIGLEP